MGTWLILKASNVHLSRELLSRYSSKSPTVGSDWPSSLNQSLWTDEWGSLAGQPWVMCSLLWQKMEGRGQFCLNHQEGLLT